MGIERPSALSRDCDGRAGLAVSASPFFRGLSPPTFDSGLEMGWGEVLASLSCGVLVPVTPSACRCQRRGVCVLLCCAMRDARSIVRIQGYGRREHTREESYLREAFSRAKAVVACAYAVCERFVWVGA